MSKRRSPIVGVQIKFPSFLIVVDPLNVTIHHSLAGTGEWSFKEFDEKIQGLVKECQHAPTKLITTAGT